MEGVATREKKQMGPPIKGKREGSWHQGKKSEGSPNQGKKVDASANQGKKAESATQGKNADGPELGSTCVPRGSCKEEVWVKEEG